MCNNSPSATGRNCNSSRERRGQQQQQQVTAAAAARSMKGKRRWKMSTEIDPSSPQSAAGFPRQQYHQSHYHQSHHHQNPPRIMLCWLASAAVLLLLSLAFQRGESFVVVSPAAVGAASGRRGPEPGGLQQLYDVPPERSSSSSPSSADADAAGGRSSPFPFFGRQEVEDNGSSSNRETPPRGGASGSSGEGFSGADLKDNEEETIILKNGFFPGNGVAWDRNGASSGNDENAHNHHRRKKNGAKQTGGGGSSSSSSASSAAAPNGAAAADSSSGDTAPEVTHWTEIMSRGWTDSPIVSAKASTKPPIWDCKVLTEYDLQQIEQYWVRLLPTVNYLGTERVAKIYRALCVAYRAHRGQMRKSGDPFIIHPVEVALLLGNLKMDGETVMAGLLHDTVEDTELTFGQLETLFGRTVRSIVEGETKVSKLPKLAFTDYADEQAENLRQMFVAMTDDYRIIIVKLADRLHNMRTLRHMKPEKQIKISRETLDIFAPLAHRMGIWQFKSELEDTAFMYLYPQEYKRLNRRLRQYQNKFRETLDKSQEILQKQIANDPTLSQQAAKVEVFGRTKELYSLWHKMETKGEHNLENIVDVVALRVIITPHFDPDKNDEHKSDRGVWLCYHVLGLVQHLPGFQPVPTRVKDYISFPKPNGYQSLHTALNLNGQTIEVQIRTSMMHQVAEYGMASHWAYTDVKRRGSNDALYNTPWLSSIKEWQNDRISSRDFVDSVRRELLGKRVFVFLRNGKILNLSRGATAIDAAFQIHTEVGLTMHGVEINGKPVPFAYELQNGDVVSILTGKGRPSTDWMRYAKSRSTRSKLRAYFRLRQKESLREAGEIILFDFLKLHGALIKRSSFLKEDFEVPSTVEELEDFLPGATRFKDVDDLLVAIGKHHDRSLLRTTVAQIFAVPKKDIATADESKPTMVPGSVVAAVHERRRHENRADAVATSTSTSEVIDAAETKSPSIQPSAPKNNTTTSLSSILDTPAEYADPEQLCEDCLPIHGDQIIGTRLPENDSITTVHRMGCPHAQRAINLTAARRKQDSIAAAIKEYDISMLNGRPKVDSVSLRQNDRIWKRQSQKNPSKQAPLAGEEPVPLCWSDLEDGSSTLFLTEIVVHAVDRKLLLADCSEVVSESAEIMKTGSSSSEEHATLVFLVKVGGLEQLQSLMDRLGQIRSVMSVERRFGSELL